MDSFATDSPVQTLLVDARPVDHPTARQRGIGRYVTGLLAGLHEIEAPIIALYGAGLEAEVLGEAIPGLRLERWSPQVVRRYATPGTWYLATQLMLHPIPLDPIPSVITAARLPVAAVMYDVIPYRYPERDLVEPNARRQAQLRAPLARTVDAMLAISQFSAATAAEELNYPIERIAVIGAGVDKRFVSRSTSRHARLDRVLPPQAGQYVVSVPGADARKNTEGLLRAWAEVDSAARTGRHLVIATAASDDVLRRWRGLADDLGVDGDVVFTGAVTDDEMVAILQRAELAVMPSTEEGFGLPVLEAAACGCPAICSNVSSLPEVLDEPAAEFDPFDPSAIARAIERALTDEAHRAVLTAAGERAVDRWRWTTVARDTMTALGVLGPRWPQRPRPPAVRLAFAGTFGGPSAVGTYDENVLAALARRSPSVDAAAIDVFVDTSDSAEPVRPPRRPVRAIGRYAKPWDYDHVIAALGAPPQHSATAQIASEISAHVWLHDASVTGIGDDIGAQTPDEIGPGLGDLLDRARSVIVASERAAAQVRALRPNGAPLLVLSPVADTATTSADALARAAAWTFDDVANALVDWLGRIDDLAPGTIERRGPRPGTHR